MGVGWHLIYGMSGYFYGYLLNLPGLGVARGVEKLKGVAGCRKVKWDRQGGGKVKRVAGVAEKY
jgi:hypothetical protein